MKNTNDTIGNRIRDIQPTAPPRVSSLVKDRGRDSSLPCSVKPCRLKNICRHFEEVNGYISSAKQSSKSLDGRLTLRQFSRYLPVNTVSYRKRQES